MVFDCIVVGAGPAGASAAYHLAKRGRSVVILEKEALPRYKPCSGGVSPAIAQWFDFDFSPAIALKVQNIRYTWKMDDPVDARLKTPEPMWVVRRDIFDHFLVKQAQTVGAELRDGTAATGIEWKGDRWQVNTVSGPIEAKYIVAADGSNGPMRQWLGFKEVKQRTATMLEAPATNSQDASAQFEFGLVKNGFIWNFPKPDANSLSVSTFRGNNPNDLPKLLEEYARKFGVDVKAAQVYQTAMNLWDGDQVLHGQNALLAGDAACVADPFSGEGVRPSMFTGVKAAEAIDQALGGQASALANYTQTITREWGEDMAWAQKLAGLFYRVPGVGYRMGIKRPAATDRIGQILCGELRYADVVGYALKKLGGGLIPGMGG